MAPAAPSIRARGLVAGLVTAVLCAFLSALLAGCTVDSAKSHYLLAEKFWNDKKYSAAVTEWDRVAARDPHSTLGLRALYHAATTQSLYLSQNAEAVSKLRRLIAINPGASEAWDIKKQIGDILFSRMQQYAQAGEQYQAMLEERPMAPEAAMMLYRVARSQFFLWRFQDAVSTDEEIQKKYPSGEWAERAASDIAETKFMIAVHAPEQGPSRTALFKQAMESYQGFIKRYPKSPRVVEAQFGIGSCQEEMDQLEAAYDTYSQIAKTYPDPKVIQIKLIRIKEREAQRSR